ncbi:CagC family type IV secretion system protein [Desemzia sp. C1]|uniref:CagC family type IV secretion system protein n=1 Tax=Desemzia sp. C1 TaxID=2892016 RepID=UPI001E35DE3F|nr:CagC family type IV secretion system protein [Desemzia sp. C1]MCI3027542.1 CagC family type IV secretion system protein [Desemzia sp. C1]
MNFLQNNFQTLYLGAAAGDIQGRISGALTTVQSVLTGIVVLVGIVVGLWIVIKRMPSADDPQEKNEVYKAIGRVLGLVAISAALVWVVPWVYSLFQ